MTTKEAIEIIEPILADLTLTDDTDLLNAEGAQALKALTHAIKQLKRFEGAVEVEEVVECYTDNTFDVMHELYSYNTKLIGTTQTHTLYAIPKEQK